MDAERMPPNIAALSQAEPPSSQSRGNPTASEVLMKFVRHLKLFHTPDREAFATGVLEGCRDTWRISDKPFRRALIRQYLKVHGKPPPGQVLNETLEGLEAQAFGETEQPVSYRVASLGDATYLDLADHSRRVIEITAGEWKVIQNAPVSFVRSGKSHALPVPTIGGTLDHLRDLLNLASEEDWQLLVGWLIGACRTVGPYPILVLQGEQGSAKSTVAKILKHLIDPCPAPIRTAPRNEQDLLIAARYAHVLAFDNLSGMQPWLSDALCRLATGGAFATRKLHTDAEEIILQAQRPVILNGIDDLLIRHDLIDRAIVLTLPPIPESARRQESMIWREVDTIRPDILGALLSAVQCAWANCDRVVLRTLPRMADFATWVTAAEPALHWEPGTFLRVYGRNREEAIEFGFDASPIASPLRDLLESSPILSKTASELLELIRSKMSEGEQRARAMPQSAQAMRNHLNRLAPALRSSGIEIIFGERKGGTGRRLITLTKRAESGVTVVTSVTPLFGTDLSNQMEDVVTAVCDKGDTRDDRQQRLLGQVYPTQIDGLGPMRRDSLGRCTDCDALTSFAYGGMRLCGTHARLRVQLPDERSELEPGK